MWVDDGIDEFVFGGDLWDCYVEVVIFDEVFLDCLCFWCIWVWEMFY